jgi:hypothetical protein
MDWLTFISDVLKAVAWPLMILIAVLIVRKPLIRIIPQLSELRYREFEVKFDELKIHADQAELPPIGMSSITGSDAEQRELGPSVLSNTIRPLARTSPRLAILETFRQVEVALQRLLDQHNLPKAESWEELKRRLEQNDLLTWSQLRTLQDLADVRNRAIQEPGFKLTSDQAIEYSEIATRIIAAIRSTH